MKMQLWGYIFSKAMIQQGEQEFCSQEIITDSMKWNTWSTRSCLKSQTPAQPTGAGREGGAAFQSRTVDAGVGLIGSNGERLRDVEFNYLLEPQLINLYIIPSIRPTAKTKEKKDRERPSRPLMLDADSIQRNSKKGMNVKNITFKK
jgi:hypothetical protein